MNTIHIIFDKAEIVAKIQNKLPRFFQIIELDNSRDGKIGMEIGSARERILIALLMSQFGYENVITDIPITKTEMDVILFNNPISIKTITHKKVVGVKLIWTVDAQKAFEFINVYKAECDILLAHINWDSIGGLYFITKDTQNIILEKMGKDFYFKLPKLGTNPRGVEITTKAMQLLINHKETKHIEINWKREILTKYTPYDKWIELWK